MSQSPTLRLQLAKATCTLLGITSAISVLASNQNVEPWDINIGVMGYSERERNDGIEVLIDATRLLTNDDSLTLGVELDTLTGATPNGATANNVAQTFTQSSGDGSYQVDANELPADDTHMDTRLAVSGSYTNNTTDTLAIDYAGRISMEFDYLSFGVSNTYELDLNQRNSTLFVGLNAEYNMVHPVGNIPDALSQMTPPGEPQNRNRASITRSTVEAGIGWTQIIDQRSLVQFRLTRSQFDGYLTDPYKILSVIDEDPENIGSTVFYLYEKRPRERNINTFYVEYRRHLNRGILTASYRRGTDTWDIDANTLDVRYRFLLSNGAWLEPHLRFYQQTAASFYRHSLPETDMMPEFASSDFRMAKFDATTIGLRFGSRIVDNRQFTLSAEYYRQEGESHPADAIGLQREQDLFPTLEAGIIKFVYSMRW